MALLAFFKCVRSANDHIVSAEDIYEPSTIMITRTPYMRQPSLLDCLMCGLGSTDVLQGSNTVIRRCEFRRRHQFTSDLVFFFYSASGCTGKCSMRYITPRRCTLQSEETRNIHGVDTCILRFRNYEDCEDIVLRYPNPRRHRYVNASANAILHLRKGMRPPATQTPNRRNSVPAHWACQRCTYHNAMTNPACEMCSHVNTAPVDLPAPAQVANPAIGHEVSADDQNAAESEPLLGCDPDTEEDDDLCVVCMVNPKTHICVPCGHKCLCGATGEIPCHELPNNKCPECRRDITAIIKVFD